MPKITEMFAFVVADKDENDEGIISVQVGDVHMPLVGADMDRVESLIPLADKIKEETGKDYKIIRFDLAMVISR